MEKRSLNLLIKQEALRLQFDGCGISKAERLEQEEPHLFYWLNHHYYAEMDYMAKNLEKRVDPTKLMKGAKSVICLLSNYKPAQWQSSHIPQIASFAYGRDYHIVLKEQLYKLKAFIDSQVTSSMRLFVDTAPILERAWAAKAGLGWIGKSNLLISPKFGPYTFISVILTNLELETDNPMEPQCGSCLNCVKACPTGALNAPFSLDARRCISYQTIEKKGPCTQNPSPYIFGCEICLRACPYGANTPYTTLFPPLPGLLQVTANEWKEMLPDIFSQRFSKSPLHRAGLQKIKNTIAYLRLV
ncbi:MAG: tRNA epoxyqueuosine(34) reductase QueG [Prevotellaceae bacterium]|jgi:epoxyqueuosine reductase|nr:tRNA epoxyqueuosine(34) reductase QueG [Prevotellaceae bacterium]